MMVSLYLRGGAGDAGGVGAKYRVLLGDDIAGLGLKGGNGANCLGTSSAFPSH